MFGNYLRVVKWDARNLLKLETREEQAACEIVRCGRSGWIVRCGRSGSVFIAVSTNGWLSEYILCRLRGGLSRYVYWPNFVCSSQCDLTYLTLYSPVVTICTAQWSLYVPHSGHYMYSQFNIQQFHVLPTVYLRVLCGSQNKQRLFPCTTLTDWFLQQRFNPLKPSGHYMYRQFNIQQFYVLPTYCFYVFCVDLRTNNHYFPIQH